MTYKARNSKNQQESKASKEIIIKESKIDKKENYPTNSLIGDCEQTRICLSKQNLETIQSISGKLSSNNDKLTSMENAITDQEKLIESVEKNDKLENKNISNMHEMLLENNNSKSKCMGAGGVLGSTGGTIVVIAGASASNPIIAGAAIFIGGIIAFCCAGVAIHGFYNLYKKPNSAVESIDIEKGTQESLQEILIN